MSDDTDDDRERLKEARESFSGRLLTNAQFREAIAIGRIVEREIMASGTFREKLADYAHAFGRTQAFDGAKAETIVRDLFKARTGQSMNQMREALLEREDKMDGAYHQKALDHARAIGPMIETGEKMSFYRAYSYQAESLASDLGITDAGAKAMMKDAFQEQEGKDLYEHGKALEEQFYRPQVEADRRETNAQSGDDGRPSRRTAASQNAYRRRRR